MNLGPPRSVPSQRVSSEGGAILQLRVFAQPYTRLDSSCRWIANHCRRIGYLEYVRSHCGQTYSRYPTDLQCRRIRRYLGSVLLSRAAEAKLLTPGEVYEYSIDLWATSNVFKAGHRLRVEIASSNFPRFDRNPQTGEAAAEARWLKPALQRVFHDESRPSHIVLPIIPRGADASR